MYSVYVTDSHRLIGQYKTLAGAKKWGSFYSSPGVDLEIEDDTGMIIAKKSCYKGKCCWEMLATDTYK